MNRREDHNRPFTTQIVDRNIHTLLERRRQEENARSKDERIAESVSNFTGSMRFVYVHLVFYSAWIIVNLPWAPAWLRFDRTFVILAMAASIEAIFLSTFILITQNRMQALANKRTDLDLQVSLLAEHEVTRLLTLVRAIAAKLEIQESENPELDELTQDVQPEHVLDELEKAEGTSPS